MASKLFISVGETCAYFTLRETYEYVRCSRGVVVNGVFSGDTSKEVRSFHHFNLSQNAEEAVRKAKEYADMVGLELVNGNVDAIQRDMREIQRASAEELKQRAEQELQWKAEREAKYAEENEKHRANLMERNIVSFGKYRGTPIAIEQMDVGYLTWVVSKEFDFEDNSLMKLLAQVIRERFSHLLLPSLHPTAYVGSIGQRVNLDVVVVRVSTYDRPRYNGWGEETVSIITMATQKGECVVSKSAKFFAKVGEHLSIKATIKDHSLYQGQAQTIVQRVVAK